MANPKITVAIVGGGIAGLILAIALDKYSDIEVHIYEAAEKFEELGVGLGFHPRSWDMLEKLGIDRELLNYTKLRPSKENSLVTIRRKSDQPEGFLFNNNYVYGTTMTFHRADVQTALLKLLSPSCHVHLSKRLVSFVQKNDSSAIELSFQDGSNAKCDLLVGADGYRSAVRRSLLEERARLSKTKDEAGEILSAVDPFFTGFIVYRATVSSDKLRAVHPAHQVFNTTGLVTYSGVDAAVVAYPIQGGKLVNVGFTRANYDIEGKKYDGPLASTASPTEVATHFGHFESGVQSLIKCLDHVTKWAIHGVKPMSSFVHKNVALMGDAAHAMTPFLGAGAGQGVEDAYILSALLGHPNTTRQTLSRALRAYDAIRRPAALAAQENSRKSGQLMVLRMNGVSFENRTDPEELADDLKRLGDAGQALLAATNTGVADSSLEEALRMLENSSDTL